MRSCVLGRTALSQVVHSGRLMLDFSTCGTLAKGECSSVQPMLARESGPRSRMASGSRYHSALHSLRCRMLDTKHCARASAPTAARLVELNNALGSY
jgi:hypothetical protein